MSDNKKKGGKVGIILLLLLLVAGVAGYYAYSTIFSSNDTYQATTDSSAMDNDSLLLTDTNFIDAVTFEGDTTLSSEEQEEALIVSEANDTLVSSEVDVASNAAGGVKLDDQAGSKKPKKVFTGRRINISVIGLDNRIGTNSNHADANHILSILPDQGIIEITAIPRDTPADAHMRDSSGQNKLTIVRASRGRQAYMKEAARIARLDRIDYYVEFGFSQAMGILELLGFKDSKSALQVLRSRKGLGGDDYQRVYNQAQFIRQTLLKHFSKVNGMFGDVLVHGALAFVETNLSAGMIKDIAKQLEGKGFGDSPDDVVIRVRPALGMKFKQYDLNNKETIAQLRKKIENFNARPGGDKSKVRNVSSILWTAIKSVEKDTVNNPRRVIAKLETYFKQKAWMQVSDINDRNSIRDNLARVLSTAYYKRSDKANAERVIRAARAEKEMFEKVKMND